MSLNKTNLRVLAALRSNGSITPRSFRAPTVDGGDELDRVAPRINELRDEGYNIETVMEKSGAGKRYARYFLRGEPGASGVSSDPTDRGADLKPQEETPEASVPAQLFDLSATPFSPYEDAA